MFRLRSFEPARRPQFTERRVTLRRCRAERRLMVRWEPHGQDRRAQSGRRRDDQDVWGELARA